MTQYCVLLVRQVVSRGILVLLKLITTYRYYGVRKRVPTTYQSQWRVRRQIGGRLGLLVSILVLLLLGVLTLAWGRLCCHICLSRVRCYPRRTTWFRSHTWPQVGLQVLLDRSSGLMVYLIPPLLLWCNAFHSWIWFSMLLSSLILLPFLLLPGRKRHFLTSIHQP